MSFRYHVVSLVAVLLALATGVALGGGPLAELGRAASPSSEPNAADQQAAAAAAFAEDTLAGAAPRLYADGLKDTSVAVVAFPGVPDQTVADVEKQVTGAGGSVSGTVDVQPSMVSAGQKALVDTLGSQLLTQLKGADIPAEATTYDRMGRLLALSLGPGQQALSVRQSLQGAELADVPDPEGRPSAVVVLLGKDSGAADDPIYTGLLAGLTSAQPSTVVAGTAADGASGRLSRLRADTDAADLTTVDGVDDTAGQITTALVLTEWPATRGHDYGASGADGAVALR